MTVKAVRFGPHAVTKFEDLRRYHLMVTREQVEQTVLYPECREIGQKGRLVATRGFTAHLVLRVIYRKTEEAFEIVTF